jgi:hypothetical protein
MEKSAWPIVNGGGQKAKESDLGISIQQEDGRVIPAGILYNMFRVDVAPGCRVRHIINRLGKALQRRSFLMS